MSVVLPGAKVIQFTITPEQREREGRESIDSAVRQISRLLLDNAGSDTTTTWHVVLLRQG